MENEEQAAELIEKAKELDPSSISPSLIEQAKSALAPVADKIGEGAEFGYEIVMRQVIAEAVVGLIGSALYIIAFFVIYRKFSPLIREMSSREGAKKRHDRFYGYAPFGDDDWFFYGGWTLFVFPVLAFVTLPIAFSYIAHFIKVLINPHYYTIQEIIRLAEGVVN